MSGQHSALDKSVEEILVELMDEKVMSVGIQESSTGGLQASSSTGRHSSRTTTEK
jgi:nicotinamide mononucleotide (NMN) deamidase PncC